MIRIADVTTKRTVDVNLELGGMESVQSLMDQACRAFGVSRIRRLVVGDLVIPRDAWDRHSVNTYLLLGEPWMVKCRSLNTSNFPILVKGMEGKTFQISNLGPQDTVEDLREEVQEKTGSGDGVRFLFSGRQLEDHRSLEDSHLTPNSTIFCVIRLPGGGFGMKMGLPFVNIDEDTLPSKREWSTNAPSWRIAEPGLCIDGTCTNHKCKSKGSRVIVNFGYTTLNLVEDVHLCCCPECKSHVEPVTCGFNNCYWSLWGRKRNTPSEPPTTVKITEKHADNAWHSYDHNQHGTAQWLALTITAKEAKDKRCWKCGGTVFERDERKLPCGHSCHEHCVSTSGDCPHCRASSSMTDFQRSRSATG